MKYSSNIVGMHHLGTTSMVRSLQIGTDVVLEREPQNQYDRNAVKCIVANRHVGYVPSAQARHIAPIMDEGKRSVTAKIARGGNSAIDIDVQPAS